MDRLTIVDAYIAAESDKAKRSILKRHKASAANVSQWASKLYGKSLRDLYGSAGSLIPPPRSRSGGTTTMAELRAHNDLLLRLVTLAWRRGAFDDLLQALGN